jgi:predicted nucleotidyltransferase
MGHLPPHLAQVVEKLCAGLKELYGDRFRGLLLYGSYARGDFREGSDIDLLLLLDGPVNTVEEIIRLEPVKWPLSLANDVVLSVMPTSLQAYQQGQTNFLRVISQEAVRTA